MSYETLSRRITAALAPHCTRRWTIRVGHEALATRVVSNILTPYVPDGTWGWLLPAKRKQRALDYARAAVDYAAGRSQWAGGLVGLPQTVGYPDAAAAASAAWAASRQR